MAELMVSKGLSGSAAAPLATVAVGIGSFCGGWTAAFCKKEHGLFCGALQGSMTAALLLILALPTGLLIENAMLLRFATAVLCGSFGGFLGVQGRGRKHLN